MMSTAPTTALTTYKSPEDPSNNNQLSTSSPSSPSNEVTLDSLPYIDNLHPDYEAYALTLIEEEMQKMGDLPSEDIMLRHLPNPLGPSCSADSTPAFKSSASSNDDNNKINVNRKEYEDLVARQGQPRTDVIDYRQKMKSMKLPKGGKVNESEWNEAIKNAKIELEYERLRMVNIELQSEYESSLWKNQTKELESTSTFLKSQLSNQQRIVDNINAKRQDIQMKKAGPKLHILSQKWEEGLKRVKLLTDGVGTLNHEVEGLRKATGMTFAVENKSQAESDDDDDL
jgi:hypothetical protein